MTCGIFKENLKENPFALIRNQCRHSVLFCFQINKIYFTSNNQGLFSYRHMVHLQEISKSVSHIPEKHACSLGWFSSGENKMPCSLTLPSTAVTTDMGRQCAV